MALKCWCKRDNLEENKMFKKLKDKKGFTLVELIVVLVILAILAALLVPALTGYIDKANEKKIIATTRQVVMAAQTEASEAYGKNTAGKLADADVTISTDATKTVTNDAVSIDAIVKLAEVGEVKDSKLVGKNGVTSVSVKLAGEDGKVMEVTVIQSGKKCVYKAEPGATEETYNVSDDK